MRLEEGRDALKSGSLSGDKAYLRAYGVFDDALEAAGLASAIDEPEERVRDLLGVAADAAPRIFRWSGTYVQSAIEIPSGESAEFVDTSAANPWTLVRGLYAAVASGDTRAEQALAELPPRAYHSEQVKVSAVADHYTRALQLVLTGEREAAAAELSEARKAATHARSEGQPQWLAQVRALGHLLDKDEDGFDADLADLSKALDVYYRKASQGFSAENHLRLAVLGLTALRARMG